MMKMYFNNDRDFEFLFKGWTIHTKAELAVACILMIVLGFVYEGLKAGRAKLHRFTSSRRVVRKKHCGYGAIDGLESESEIPEAKICRWDHFVHTFLCMVQLFMGYVLMLAFMTYNSWIGGSIIFGVGLGFYIFDSLSLPMRPRYIRIM